jgi:DNA-binding NarL/FixJ family response regulator
MTGLGSARLPGSVPSPMSGREMPSAPQPLTGRRPTLVELTVSRFPQRPDAPDPVAGSSTGRAALVSAEELAILRHIADGLPIDSVAQRVGTSPRTVRRRMRNLCDRIGVTCAIQAVVWAAHRGLV